MTKKTSITCDHCETELVVDSMHPHNYTLELRAVDTGINTSGATYAVAVYPPIDGTKHFCGLGCLNEWLGGRVPTRSLEA